MYGKSRAYSKGGNMNVLKELEDMRRRMLQEINTEFDVIIDRIAQESGNDPKAFVGSCEMKYPLTAGAGIFKGKKPAAVIIGGECVAVRTWRQLVGEIMTRCISIPKYRIALESLAGKVSGKKRVLLAGSPEGMRSPLVLTDGLCLETHYDTETLLNILTTRILSPIGYDYSGIYVTVRNM